MQITEKWKKIFKIIQWVLIALLVLFCVYTLFIKKDDRFVRDMDVEKEQSYIKIYESQEIKNLKKQNQELYDSIKKLKNVESGIEIRYKYKYQTDTIWATEFIKEEIAVTDTVDNIQSPSIYHYTADNDTVKYDMEIMANDLIWAKGNFVINDKFQIINREKDGQNELIINHSENVDIEGVDAWHRVEDKEKWYKNFHFGVQLGGGYGLINKKFDVFVGAGLIYVIK